MNAVARFVGASLAAIILFAVSARAEIEFVGLLVLPARSTFALTAQPGKSTVWRTLGEEIGGYTVESFDSKTDTLTLAKTGAPPLRLRLKDDAKVKSARFEISGELKAGRGEKLTVNRATLLFDEENVFPLGDGLVLRLHPTRRSDGTCEYRLSFDQTIRGGKVTISSPRIIALADQPFSMKTGELEFSFQPKPN
ncbi:MAG: hypothetical protein HZA93_04790 [Verrucomicrobia bacterium]|nr:hypothetical protein [Verrucomicrobiota bacterium]